MIRNLRNIFQRAHPTDQEVQTLRGVVRALVGRRQRGWPDGRDQG